MANEPEQPKLDLAALERASRPKKHWYNEEGPIRDLREALYLLNIDGSSNDPHHLAQDRDTKDWEVVAPWYHEGSSGADTSGYDYFQIDQALAEQLVREGFVTTRRVNYMGGFYLNSDELVLSDKAREQVQKFEQDMRLKAQSLLTIGIHTDLTGEVVSGGWGREHRLYGRMHFDFVTPNGRCRVYPETSSVVFPYPPPQPKSA